MGKRENAWRRAWPRPLGCLRKPRRATPRLRRGFPSSRRPTKKRSTNWIWAKKAEEALGSSQANRPLEMVEAEARLQVLEKSVDETNSRVADLSERMERRGSEQGRWREH